MNHTRKNPEEQLKKRIKLILLLMVMLTGGIVGKLFKLQVLEHDALTRQSERQYKRKLFSRAKRGVIYDRNFREMAADVELDSIYANPAEITDAGKVAKLLSNTLGEEYDSVFSKLISGKSFVWIKRHALLGQSADLKKRGIKGVGFIKEYKRFYPKMDMASRLLGFAGVDNMGLAGIEFSYNNYLRGGGRWLIVEKDAKGRSMRSIQRNSRKFQRSDIVLTIDEVIQHIAEKELGKMVKKVSAKDGVALVMSPNTGEILAMADYPPFNPNNFKDVINRHGLENIRNKAVSNAYEPGSTFKIFLAAAAIESGIKPDSMFYCEDGEFRIGKVAIHEASAKKYEWLSLLDIITKSSNIGAIKIAERLKKERFYDFITRFGFGSKTGIDLEGENTGLARDINDWTPLSICSIAMGQEISVTPIQLITALSAIANGGFLLKPHVVKGIYRDGNPLKIFQPEIIRRVISKETSRTLTSILKRVVDKGTGKKAMLKGYSIVGKTGTAQKFDTGRDAYSKTKYLASFAGYFPAESPQLVILVIINEPKNIVWGGSVAAPVFREIASQTARRLNIPSKRGKVIWARNFHLDGGRKDSGPLKRPGTRS